MSNSYCIYCGNTGVMADGEVCTHCKASFNIEEEVDLTYLEVPISYRGAQFSTGLLPKSMGEYYASFLGELYNEIISLKPMCKNVFISSPLQTGKTVFVYSCMEQLYRKKCAVFPYFDINEIGCIMRDLDRGKKSEYVKEDIDAFNVYEAEVLFVKVPEKLEYGTGEILATLIDRRVRRSHSTIILSSKPWTELVETNKILKDMTGDGSFKSILVKNYWREK